MTNRYEVIARKGDVTPSEGQTLFRPGKPRPTGKFGVILLHGSGADYSSYSEALRWATSELAAWIALAGIPCLSIQMGGNQYANDIAMEAVDDGIPYLAAETDASASKVFVIGESMGGGTAARYGEVQPAKTAGIVGIYPMANPQRIYEDNTLGLQEAIGDAWGVTYPTPLPSGADLIGNAGIIEAAGIPSQFWYDNGDVVIDPQDVIDLAAASGGTATEIPTTDAGHTERTVKSLIDMGAGRASEVINFLLANGA